MTDSIIAEATAKREAAAAEVRRWDDFIAMYREITGGAVRPMMRPTVPPIGKATAPRTSASTGALAETEAAAVAAIQDAGGPIPTRDMLEELRVRGVEVGGKDPASTLSARLSRSRLLENVRPYGWRIKELADDEVPTGSASSANVQPRSGPVEPGQEVAHEVGGVFK